MSGPADRWVPGGPYETERQAAADVAEIYEQCRWSARRSLMAEANRDRLTDACERAGVALGAFDARILSWLGNYEPETCAVIAGLVTRAHAAGLAAAVPAPLLAPGRRAGRHATCPGHLCQCPEVGTRGGGSGDNGPGNPRGDGV